MLASTLSASCLSATASPLKRVVSRSASSLLRCSRSCARVSAALAMSAARCFSEKSSSRVMQSSLRARQQYLRGWLSSWRVGLSDGVLCFLKPAIRSCFSKELRLRPRRLLSAPTNSEKLKMFRAWWRESQQLSVPSQRACRVSMSSMEGRFLGRQRGGGANLEKLWKLITNQLQAGPAPPPPLLIFTRMEREQPTQFASLIDRLVLVSLHPNCRARPDSHDLRWITSLEIVTGRQCGQEGSDPTLKYVEMGNDFYLKIGFCEAEKQPISRLKIGGKTLSGNYRPLAFPRPITCEEYLHFEVDHTFKGSRIIQDLQMVEVTAERDTAMPAGHYEVVKLPHACQIVHEENSSNEQLIEKTRYLIVKSVDLEDQDDSTQLYEPTATQLYSADSSELDPGKASTLQQFCFPEGVALMRESRGGHLIFNFVLTHHDGNRFYVNCLKLPQPLPPSVIASLPHNCLLRHHPHLFAQTAFCILSHYCYTDFFHNLLREIFRSYQSIQNQNVPSFASRSQGYIPSPTSLGEVLADFTGRYELAVGEARAVAADCEFMGEAVGVVMVWNHNQVRFPAAVDKLASLYSPRAVFCLFKVLSVRNIVRIMQALLLERKLVLISDSQMALGYVIEALLSFLYPLQWEHSILPILSENMLELLQAPMPLIAGLPTSLATDDLLLSIGEASVVFLDLNTVLQSSEEAVRVNHLREAEKKLKEYEIHSKEHVAQMLEFKEQLEMFEIYEANEGTHFSAEHIKHIFLETMLHLLQGYHLHYATCQSQPTPHHNHFSFKRDYKVEDFIRSHPRPLHYWMGKFTECSHFVNFICRHHQPNRQTLFINSALTRHRHAQSPLKPHHRRSEQPALSAPPAALRKHPSLPASPSHPAHSSHPSSPLPHPTPSKKSLETNYSDKLDRPSLKLQECEDQKPETGSRGGQICEAISRAMHNAAETRRNVMLWTQARVNRLKKYFSEKERKDHGMKRDSVEVQQGQNPPKQEEGGSGPPRGEKEF